MTFDTAWPVPFFISPENLAIDAVVAFVVSVLLAVWLMPRPRPLPAPF